MRLIPRRRYAPLVDQRGPAQAQQVECYWWSSMICRATLSAAYAAALDLVASGQVRVDSLVTAGYGLDRFAEALDDVRGGRGVKAQTTP